MLLPSLKCVVAERPQDTHASPTALQHGVPVGREDLRVLPCATLGEHRPPRSPTHRALATTSRALATTARNLTTTSWNTKAADKKRHNGTTRFACRGPQATKDGPCATAHRPQPAGARPATCWGDGAHAVSVGGAGGLMGGPTDRASGWTQQSDHTARSPRPNTRHAWAQQGAPHNAPPSDIPRNTRGAHTQANSPLPRPPAERPRGGGPHGNTKVADYGVGAGCGVVGHAHH